MVRAVDVAEVGAGGGSLVSLDAGGSFQVGPRSAGAEPGPVCYDRGGEEPTTSDANVLLGYLNPEYLLGGSLKVNLEKTRLIFDEKVARPLGLSVLEAAYGVHVVANASMARAHAFGDHGAGAGRPELHAGGLWRQRPVPRRRPGAADEH